MTTKILNRPQARWAQDIAGINFKICYCPASQIGKPEALSRHLEICTSKEGGEIQLGVTVLHNKHFEGNMTPN
jgi:hypothetical protein